RIAAFLRVCAYRLLSRSADRGVADIGDLRTLLGIDRRTPDPQPLARALQCRRRVAVDLFLPHGGPADFCRPSLWPQPRPRRSDCRAVERPPELARNPGGRGHLRFPARWQPPRPKVADRRAVLEAARTPSGGSASSAVKSCRALWHTSSRECRERPHRTRSRAVRRRGSTCPRRRPEPL